jgi:CHAT domain-containing protein/Tfp pilus assembly protein PilF
MKLPQRSFSALVLCVVALITAASHAQAPPQTKAADQALVQLFAAASTDEARAALLQQHPELSDQANRTALSTYANAMLQRRELAAAESAFRSLLWLADYRKDDRGRAGALSGLGSVWGQRGNLTHALTLLHQALALAEPIGDPIVLQPIYSTLGVVERRLGDYDKAAASFERSLALAIGLKRADMEGRVYNNIGAMHLSRGHLDQALDYFKRSLDKKQDDGGRGTIDMANTLNNIGAVHEELGDVQQALPYFTRARDLMEKIGAPAGAITALGNIGHARAALGQTVLARQAFQEALTRGEAAGDGNAVATILHNLGNLERESGDLESAESFHRRSFAMREAGGDVAGLSESRAELARLMLMLGRLPEAEAEATRAVTVAGAAGQLGHLARAQLYLGQVYERQDRLDKALSAFEAAVTAAERLRESSPRGERARQVFLDQRVGPYYSVAAIHARAGRPLEGLIAVERVRARTLLDILATGRQPKRALTDDERARELALDAAALSFSLQLAEMQKAARPNATVVSSLQESLRVARQEKEAFTIALYAARPQLRILRGDAPLITAERLGAVLTPGTAAIEFVVEPSRVWAYLAVGGPAGIDVSVKQLTLGGDALRALASDFTGQVARRDLSFAVTSGTLYSALLGAFDRQLNGIRHLIIVPDAVLWKVPFQALISPRGRFLIEERAVSYAPSLSALAALHERQSRRAAAPPFMLALGDPATASAARLPEAAREVQSLGKLYGAGRSAVFVSASATEESFRKEVSKASVVHIATHGVLDDNNPMYSHLKLAVDDLYPDGRLEAWELLDLDINADVAVLSACHTASGAIGGGEGVVGLSWALFAAGASSAVVSQWEVDSASTTALMVGFHQRLLDRKPAATTTSDALREAAVNLMKDPRFRHPFYWAGFIVIGAR